MGWPSSNPPSPIGAPRLLVPFATPTTVSTVTPLMALRTFGDRYVGLAICLRNYDAVNKAALYVDRSESGVAVEDDRQVLYVSPLKERVIEFRDIVRLWWGLSASGDPDAAFPSVQVAWQILGTTRG